MTEDEMVGWHHRLDGHNFEQAQGDGEGQGSLVYCSPLGHKELDMTEGLNNKNSLSTAISELFLMLSSDSCFTLESQQFCTLHCSFLS